jgi:hypothetical protein
MIQNWCNDIVYPKNVIVNVCVYHKSLETWTPSQNNSLWESVDEPKIYKEQPQRYDISVLLLQVLSRCVFG